MAPEHTSHISPLTASGIPMRISLMNCGFLVKVRLRPFSWKYDWGLADQRMRKHGIGDLTDLPLLQPAALFVLVAGWMRFQST